MHRHWPIAGLSLVLVASVASARAPAQVDIAIDGRFEDWAEVLTNPLNSAVDGQGSLIDCALTTDRDCPLPGLSHDIAELGWTWNFQWLFLHVRRIAPAVVTRSLWLHVDADRDGFMALGEPVVQLEFDDRFGTVALKGWTYRPAGGSPDPLVDAQGLADGNDMPGSVDFVGMLPGLTAQDTATLRCEAAIPLPSGLPGNHVRPVQFNACLGDGAGSTDSMGGAGGAIGTTVYRGLTASPGLNLSEAPGAVVQAWHSVRATGNVPTTLRLRAISSTGWDVTFRRDVDGDGLAETYLGTDAGGDGVMSLPGDVLTIDGDSDGDGALDLGLGVEESVDFVLEQVVPATATGVEELVEWTAWLAEDPAEMAVATDRLRVGAVTIQADEERLGAAGDVVWVPHVVQNNGASTTVVDLALASGRAWNWSFYRDPTPDGDPADAVPLDDTDGSGRPDVPLFAGGRADVFARGMVKPATPIGAREEAVVRAVLGGSPVSVVLDGVTVAEPVRLEPSYLAALGEARYGTAGGHVYLPHRLTNARGVTTSYDLSIVSDLGWPAIVLSDPDGDGRPYDSERLPDRTGLVAANGGVVAFIVRVDVPTGSLVGDTAHLVVTATAQDDASVVASVEDDAVAAIVRVYADAGRVVNVARVTGCGTAYAEASGLVPSSMDYRFAWRDAAGAIIAIRDAATDATGRTQDELTLDPTHSGPGFSVDIEQWTGSAHVTLDTAIFAVGDEISVTSLELSAPTADVAGGDVQATATLRNDSYDQPADPMDVRWVVLTPDGLEYLALDGTFRPYGGTEATRTSTLALGPREEVRDELSVPQVTFPTTGTYAVEVHRRVNCAAEALAASTSLLVLDDADDDGLDRAVELASGTDPTDADTDDDGLLDGDDGLGDADGDTAPDALDCDSDDDGILDGTETGAWSSSPDTNVAAGCFRADLGPLSTTDPDRADTDGGGLSDGIEDADHDGRRDTGERDPLDPSDDAGACGLGAPPELTGLRVSKQGTAAALAWDPVSDPCVTYTVLVSALPSGFGVLDAGLPRVQAIDPTPLGAERVRFYLVRGDSWLHGPGPSGS